MAVHMVSRLGQLFPTSADGPFAVNERYIDRLASYEADTNFDPTKREKIEGILSSVDCLWHYIDEIRKRNQEIPNVQMAIISKPVGLSSVVIERHEKLVNEVVKLVQSVQKGVTWLDEEIKKEELVWTLTEEGMTASSIANRIRKCQYCALNHQLKEVVLQFSKNEEAHRERYAAMLQQRSIKAHTARPRQSSILQEPSVFTQLQPGNPGNPKIYREHDGKQEKDCSSPVFSSKVEHSKFGSERGGTEGFEVVLYSALSKVLGELDIQEDLTNCLEYSVFKDEDCFFRKRSSSVAQPFPRSKRNHCTIL